MNTVMYIFATPPRKSSMYICIYEDYFGMDGRIV